MIGPNYYQWAFHSEVAYVCLIKGFIVAQFIYPRPIIIEWATCVISANCVAQIVNLRLSIYIWLNHI